MRNQLLVSIFTALIIIHNGLGFVKTYSCNHNNHKIERMAGECKAWPLSENTAIKHNTS